MAKSKLTPQFFALSIEISQIKRLEGQPRKRFDRQKLDELKQSIKQQGILVPITVRKVSDDYYILIDGERRFRCCQELGWKKIPAHIRFAEAGDCFEASLVSNLHRVGYNPIEEALAFQELKNRGYTHEEIAELVGKSPHLVGQRLLLLQLPKEVQDLIFEEKLPPYHVVQLSQFRRKKDVIRLARYLIDGKLTHEELEAYLKQINGESETTDDLTSLPSPLPLSQKTIFKRMKKCQNTLNRSLGALRYIIQLDEASFGDFFNFVGVYPKEKIIHWVRDI